MFGEPPPPYLLVSLKGMLNNDLSQLYMMARLDLINVFEVFLPQLLRYPNPADPLNGEAAAMLMRHPKDYDTKVKGTLHSSSL